MHYKFTIFREEATSALACFHAGPQPLSWSIDIWRCRCLWREENRRTRRKTLGGENQQQTQPTYDIGRESNSGHIGGRRALSPLRPPCPPKDHYQLIRILSASLIVFNFKSKVTDGKLTSLFLHMMHVKV